MPQGNVVKRIAGRGKYKIKCKNEALGELVIKEHRRKPESKCKTKEALKLRTPPLVKLQITNQGLEDGRNKI